MKTRFVGGGKILTGVVLIPLVLMWAAVPATAASVSRSADADLASLRTAAQPAGCLVQGPPKLYAPTMEDFGWGGEPYVELDDASYWDGRGYLFSYRRSDADGFRSQPRGGYLAGGIVLAPEAAGASRDLQDALRDWTKEWASFQSVPVSGLGDEALAVRRLSSWEIAQDQPMDEVFLGFRFCNATAHIMLATMPEYDALGQASRYAEIIRSRMEEYGYGMPSSTW